MGITAEAPRGGVVEEIDGVTYTFILRNREIERFEDKHRGIFEVWYGFFDRGKKPTTTEVRNLLALALVGGGKKDSEADAIIESGGPESLLLFYQIAQAVLGVAFMPDALSEVENKKKDLTEGQSQEVLTSAA